MRIAENIVLGLDLGYTSIGWALIEEDSQTQERRIHSKTSADGVVYALGSRIIDAPEDAKTRELLNVNRREKRAARRVIARKAQRMRALRHLFFEAGVTNIKDIESIHNAKGRKQVSPWVLRDRGLKEKLSPEEFAIALLHIAKHRGFHSNSKAESADADTGKVKEALDELDRKLKESGAETIGQYMAAQKIARNRANYKGEAQYFNVMKRIWQKDEVHLLFERQRSFGSALAGTELESRYESLAFDQRELKSVADMVGNCVFLDGEKRAPSFAPVAEQFRFLQRIVHLRLRAGGNIRPLTPEEQQKAAKLFGKTAKITYKALRNALKLMPDVFFDDLSYPSVNGKPDMKEENGDIVRRSGEACAGTVALRKCLGEEDFEELSRRLTCDSDPYPGWPVIDRIAKILSDNDGFKRMEEELAALDVDERIREKIMAGARAGRFAKFRGTMNLSVKAMLAIIPHLRKGLRYDEACKAAGFDYNREREIDINDIRNPVVQHLMREMRRQVRSICHEFGFWPGRVNIELLREVGKSVRERQEIERGQKKRARERQSAREYLAKLWGKEPSDSEVKRYELWKEQKECCAYAQLIGTESYKATPEGHIPLDWLKGDQYVQIDHILPRSRTFDNSMANQCLCLSNVNQNKLNQTPFEWHGRHDPEAWNRYTIWINSLSISNRKKRAFLLQDLSAEVEHRFHARNLTDSAYVARLAAQWFCKEYDRLLRTASDEERKRRRVFTRPGTVTNFLRHVWGVGSLKKNEKGEREGDQHHALDAVIVACCTEGMLQSITKAFKRNEVESLNGRLPHPWADFRSSLSTMINDVFVSREEYHKKSGALHEETLRAIREEKRGDETLRMVYERKWVDKLTLNDLGRIKYPERCKCLIAALREWLELDPKTRPPFTDPATGNVVRHVRLERGEFTSGVLIQRGSGTAQADNGEMSRVDVYTKEGKFYLVPVYLKDIASGMLPVRACRTKTPEAQWILMDESYEFLFSLVRNCYVVTENKKGETKEGYYNSMDRSTASINLSLAEDKQKRINGLGVLRLNRLEKYHIDRLGRRIRVRREPDPRKA